MMTIDVTATELVVEMTGWDRLWTLRRRLAVPLEHIRRAAITTDLKTMRPGLRLPGTHWPGAITAGTYRKDGEWWFWNVRRREKAIIVDLENERYDHMVLEVDDPEAVVDAIEVAVAGIGTVAGQRSS
jgi:hypothetical protein